jgi:hypothetical protein
MVNGSSLLFLGEVVIPDGVGWTNSGGGRFPDEKLAQD